MTVLDSISLNVISLNIHKASYKKGLADLFRLRDVIRSLDCDLVFLQEVVGANERIDSDRLGFSSQFEFLADELWPHFSYAKNSVYNGGHHGNAILSKYPIRDWNRSNISTNYLEGRGLLHCLVEIPTAKERFFLHALCVHLDLTQMGRSKQFELIKNRIAQHIADSEPVILAGDFNDWNQKAEEIFVNEIKMSEAHVLMSGKNARTFPSFKPFLSLDRIYVRNIEVEGCVVPDEPVFSVLSDHRPIKANLRIRAGRTECKGVLRQASFEFYRSGQGLLNELIGMIESAKQSVSIHIYTFASDRVGTTILAALERAARRGIKVSLLIDAIGSLETNQVVFSKLRAAGAKVRFFNLFLSWRRIHIGRRLHQKIVLVDQRNLLLGGMNFSDSYFYATEGSLPWLDFAVSVKDFDGSLLDQYMSDIYKKSPINIHPKLPIFHFETEKKELGLSINDWLKGYFQINRIYLKRIEEAKESLYIVNAYFIPDLRLVRALKRASERGVDIHIVIPYRSDVKIAKWVGESIYQPLINSSINIYQWTPSILHAKLMIVDAKILILGSFNLDISSRFFNLDANVELVDQKTLDEALTQIRGILRNECKKVQNKRGKINGNIAMILKSFLASMIVKLTIVLMYLTFPKNRMPNQNMD